MRRYKVLLMMLVLTSCKNNSSMMDNTATYAIRLKPGTDLQLGIEKAVADYHIQAGWIATSVGSLTQYNIRFANQPGGNTCDGHFEIVSLTGTVSINGSHLHISVSDSTGKTIGGHLLDSNIVYTTAEIVILSSESLEFKRAKDGSTPWEELQVQKADDK